jgi:hypothetical protein
MYTVASTTVSILRGTTYDDQGDVEDSGSLIATGVLAQINAQRVATYGVKTYEPGTPVPSTVRLFEGVFPSGTDVENTDQIRDERSGRVYEVVAVIDTLWEYLQPDLNAVLKRITATTQA